MVAVIKSVTWLSIVFFITAFHQVLPSKDYKGAELRTKEDFLYGRFEAHYKSAAGTGILSNFFIYHTFETGTADWNEVDIEILGRYDDDIQCTTIGPRQFIYNSHTTLPFNPHDGFHTYAFEWTPVYVAWFVDNKEIYRQTGEHIQALSRASKIMMNIWADDGDGTWTGPWKPETLPYFAFYDWVSYYSWTPDSGHAGTGNNFSFEWRDDFNTWDTLRWDKATHTWGGNRVDFTHDNAVFEDGKLILCLTTEEHQGYVDVQPPTILWARAEDNQVHVEFSEAVDSLTALDQSNYSIPGVNIENIKLERDKRAAILTVDRGMAGQDYSVVSFGLKDLWVNNQPYIVREIFQNPPLTFPLKINVGGDAIYDSTYLPDQIWGPDVAYGRMDGYVDAYPASIDILNTALDSLYLHSVHEVVKYRVRCPDGVYNVVLHFAENLHSENGKREFDINIEGEYVVSRLDVHKEAGQHTAMDVRVDDIQVKDGMLEIAFNNNTGDPFLAGLTVENVFTGIRTSKKGSPESFVLKQNYPNPFNAVTTIRYNVGANGDVATPNVAPQDFASLQDVELTIHNVLGQKMATLVSKKQSAGEYAVTWDAGNFPSGIYYYRLTGKSSEAVTTSSIFVRTRKMILLK